MIETDKLRIVVAFVIGFGAGSLSISWFTFSKNQNAYSTLAQRVEQVNTNLSGFKNAFDRMNVELRQLKMALDSEQISYARDQAVVAMSQPGDDGLNAINSDADAEPADDDRLAPAKKDVLSQQESRRVTLVIDKLRAHDAIAFPDLPSLMSSAEVTNMSPAALDRIMAEVSRMVEQGELDPSFFPNN